MDIQNKKVLFADLDGTMIQTASGKTFAEDCTDFRIRKDVLDKIKQMKGLYDLHIVTNQGGIPQFITKDEFEIKLTVVCEFIKLYTCDSEGGSLYVSANYCASLDKNNPSRKPNTGMLDKWLKQHPDYQNCKDMMLMIGDASGKEGQFSDSDKVCAERFGIDYLDVEDFLKA